MLPLIYSDNGKSAPSLGVLRNSRDMEYRHACAHRITSDWILKRIMNSKSPANEFQRLIIEAELSELEIEKLMPLARASQRVASAERHEYQKAVKPTIA